MKELSIIIVNYKTPQLVIDCVHSIYLHHQTIDCEIIIVDNASQDESQSIITAEFPQVKWIQMSYNSGFARANNEGIRQSSANTILLLNSDTLIEDDAVQQSYLKFMQSSFIACGVQLLNTDRSPQISGNFFMRGSLNNLLPLPYVGSMIKVIGNGLKVKKTNVPDARGEVEVDWINGAFLMVKRPAIEKVGLMDEDFFLYAEEAEWCSRLRKSGRLCIYGQYHVIHLQGETSNEVFGSRGRGYYDLYDKKGLQIMLSNFVRIRKQFGIAWYLFHMAAYLFTIPVYFFVGFIHNLFLLRNPFAHIPRAISFAGNVFRALRFLPILISNKPHFYKVL